MAYGLAARPVGGALVLAFDWPEGKRNRRVRELRFDAAGGGPVETCAFERLPSDLALPELFEKVRSHLGDAKSRADFVDGPGGGDARVLDQLFFEAAAGGAEALDLLKLTGEGLDGGPSETVAGYVQNVDELRAKKCRWR
jgi:hypothetical protein